ncbi:MULTISPECIES: hypothetical protein [unclassified Rhizobium]|uniref:hypothetical protein n=1 Tax=unclassified Rhizobium TaxID=2613769 RepID=UPI001ADA054F|nr:MULTISPECIES: hypothetical protein [unclassified Rhizobium]MBO9099473.1 hypothetical protein [Rhizobium sp. L58/93]QXZ87044.1 hypothetical protein J5287_20865 [Rhizobium sp. K1/93]QXZ92922.1 hypothetical protein J5280_20030 [Rhizobium sp. K15/93]
MLTAARKFLIEANETYVSRDTARGDRSFLSESPYLGKTYQAADLTEEFDDTATAIFRVNLDAMTIEPITEDIAQAWILDRDNREGGLDDEDKFPAYVRDSLAWKVWNHDALMMRPVEADPDYLRDRRRGDAAFFGDAAA